MTRFHQFATARTHRAFIRVGLCWLFVLFGIAGFFCFGGRQQSTQSSAVSSDDGIRRASFVSRTPRPGFRTKNIEDVRAGDKVWAVDPVTGQWAVKTVLRPLVHDYEGDLVTVKVAGQTIEATGNHPFWVVRGQDLSSRRDAQDVPPKDRQETAAGRWVEARDLQAGDMLLLKDRGSTSIDLVLVRQTHQPVYNIEVADIHNYAVSLLGAVVHNKCFPPGTLVLMADGSTNPIEQVRLGDEVLACDPESGLPPAPARVEGLWRDFTACLMSVEFRSANGEIENIEATRYHPFWTDNRGWVPAKDLVLGDLLRNAKNQNVQVVAVCRKPTGSRSYNLTIQGSHTFFACATGRDAILTHNAIIYVDPRDLFLPTQRQDPDLTKFAEQYKQYGTQTQGMRPIQVYEGPNGYQIADGLTRASRAAIDPANKVPIEPIQKLPTPFNTPKVGDIVKKLPQVKPGPPPGS